ncbi:MAG: tRNA (cytidine(34)-2'-O)-methyltransferase [Alphaproteobacteria bacterium]|nr:tRNA (cytidine(34)-2'-O)-methyltransferase [Alphaproteobacteria bacterium]
MLKIVLFQPEIAGNVGAIIRNCAVFGADLHIIEPCGFPFDMNRIKKSALDYLKFVKIIRHQSFQIFYETYFEKKNARLILATTKASKNLFDFQFNENDFIIFGNESSGAPQEVHEVSDFRVKIFMEAFRSINIATSTGIFLAKARNDINI